VKAHFSEPVRMGSNPTEPTLGAVPGTATVVHNCYVLLHKPSVRKLDASVSPFAIRPSSLTMPAIIYTSTALISSLAAVCHLPRTPSELSLFARQGSGFACRSLFGGSVALGNGTGNSCLSLHTFAAAAALTIHVLCACIDTRFLALAR
jgi:hypothetical protein